MKKKYTILISGATATGKSSYAIDLAKKVSGEIINADIGSFYKPLTIGTAKPDWQNELVPHHLFDVLDKPISFTVAEFRKQLFELMREIWQRGNVPIVVGGSIFYIQAFFYKQHEISGTEPFIKELEQGVVSTQDLWDELNMIDSERAQNIYRQDRYRIIRALAIYKATGKKPSEFKPIFDPLSECEFLICDRDRTELYKRIDDRVVQMVNQGWLDEVRVLQNSDWKDFLMRKKMIGYDDLLAYLTHGQDLDDIVAKIQKRTRNYAKRQIAFLKKLESQINREYLSGFSKKVKFIKCF